MATKLILIDMDGVGEYTITSSKRINEDRVELTAQPFDQPDALGWKAISDG